MKIDLKSCRFCLENIGVIPFFQAHGDEIVSEMIRSIFNINVIYNVTLPTTICSNCLENIKLCILTKNIILNSESILNTYLKSNLFRESAVNLKQIKVEDEDPVVIPELIGLEAEEIKIERSDDSLEGVKDEQCTGLQIVQIQSLTAFNPQIKRIPNEIHSGIELGQETKHFPTRIKQEVPTEQHIPATHLGEKTFLCSYCDKAFSSNISLKVHKKVHFPPENYQLLNRKSTKKHKCDLCNQYFTTPHSLKRHKIIHSGVKEQVCRYCGKKFALIAYLKLHIQLIHEKNDPRNIKCKFCGIISTNISKSRRHLLTHNPDKPL